MESNFEIFIVVPIEDQHSLQTLTGIFHLLAGDAPAAPHEEVSALGGELMH